MPNTLWDRPTVLRKVAAHGRALSAKAKEDREELDKIIGEIGYAKSSLKGMFKDDKEGLAAVLLEGENMDPKSQHDYYGQTLAQMEVEKKLEEEKRKILKAEADWEQTEARTNLFAAQTKNLLAEDPEIVMAQYQATIYTDLVDAWKAHDNQPTAKTKAAFDAANARFQSINASSEFPTTASDVLTQVLGFGIDPNTLARKTPGTSWWEGMMGKMFPDAREFHTGRGSGAGRDTPEETAEKARRQASTSIFPQKQPTTRGQGRGPATKTPDQIKEERAIAEALLKNQTPEQLTQQTADRIQRAKRQIKPSHQR